MKKKSEELENELQAVRNEYLELIQASLTGSIYRDFSQAPFGSQEYDADRRAKGLDWPEHAQTMIGEKRLANLRALTESVIAENIPGDLIETGVWRGGACILMRAVLFANDIPDRIVWVADSFKGLPLGNELQYPADANSDFHTYEQLSISLDEVKENFRFYGLLNEQTKFIDGWFKDTLPTAPIGQLALMRLDADMFESTMDALTNLYPKLSHGGYIIIDDYHVVPACRNAVQDYCEKNEIIPEIVEIDGVGVYWQKKEMSGSSAAAGKSIPKTASTEMQITRLHEAIAELSRIVIGQLNRSLTDRDKKMSEFKRTVDNLKKQVAGLDRLVAERNAEITSLRQFVMGQKAMIARLSGELSAFYSSVSWRITKPMRALKKFVDRGRYRSGNSGRGKNGSYDPLFQTSSASETPVQFTADIASNREYDSGESSHIYEYDFDLSSDSAAAKVTRMVGRNKRVLEIGAGPGSIAKILTHNNGCRVTGVDIDPSAIKKLSRVCEAVYRCDLNASEWTSSLSGCGTFDVIVAADVLEHLYHPEITLIELKRFLSPDGYLVISLPHVGYNAVIAGIFQGDFGYHDWGLLDRTHIRFFGIQNMQQLIDDSGYIIISAEYVTYSPEETEFVTGWKETPASFKAALARNRYGSIYQVVIKVALAKSGISGIRLTDLPIPGHITALVKSFGSLLHGYLDQRIFPLFLRRSSK